MKDLILPDGLRIEILNKSHHRQAFESGQADVDGWLRRFALQSQDKFLNVTKVLVDAANDVAGYYTLASNQVNFSDLPVDVAKKLPKRALPVTVLAWFGIDRSFQGKGLGTRLLGQVFRDYRAILGTIGNIALIVDCISDASRDFFLQYDFVPLPGHTYRLFMSTGKLIQAMH